MSDPGFTSNDIRSSLKCSICLELFTMPVSTACGHNFCQKCINDHWDQEVRKQIPYSCPRCRKIFPERPETPKNVDLSDLVETVRALEKQNVSQEPEIQRKRNVCPATKCQRHNRNFELFCCTEKRCVCSKCYMVECRNHTLESIEEKRQMEEEQLRKSLLGNANQKEEIRAAIEKRQQLTGNIKTSCDKMETCILAKFEELSNVLEVCCTMSIETLRSEEGVALAKAEQSLEQLQKHLERVEQHENEAEQLCQNPDDVAFLQGFTLLVPPEAIPVLPSMPLCGSSQVDAVTRILPQVINLLKVEFPNALLNEPSQAEVKETSCTPSPPKAKTRPSITPSTMSQLRAELYKDYRNLTFEPRSANKYIQLSRQNCKASHKMSSQGAEVLISSSTFQTWQVMCTEGFSSGHHYWEVELSAHFVEVGVAYDCLERSKNEQNKIGRNPFSWSLQIHSRCHSAWHANTEQQLQAPKYTKVGVSLDCEAGTLTFYGVRDGGLELLHSFSCIFSQALYPTFWIGEGASVSLFQYSAEPGNTSHGE
ncbi:hypothetical protein XENTR_v10004381 [Xenopus tropicalis]|uniref:Tripartite motif-containing protein 65 n=1 Tax=Xenopus tropicalis TaxID=8364 RepID=A0A8J0QWP6_XENTR|nr:tripartite motif-containing protein 65 [Xenopus tropicalis]KAE8576953.1 hypothetical protein XENTR_v10004381 [Xenopus tropicalis]KAE8576954.1 hypothetical protein XENTR_v10004381 [Xenopus tropicalis]|eukprot:XP_002940023.1 PREDICTED: tripartite motif-containing protein 65 [Xenopus tropicalis]